MERLNDLIHHYHLTAFATDIHHLLRESIRLVSVADHNPSSIGISHFGGSPDLPPDFQWPQWQGVPQSFIAQIRLDEVAGFTPARMLPPEGLLSFFYDANQETYGDQPSDQGGWSVFFFANLPVLKPAAFPEGLPDPARFASLDVRFVAEWTLPESPQQVDPEINWSDQTTRQYEQMLAQYRSEVGIAPPYHRMFGYPDQLQDDMQFQSEQMIEKLHGSTAVPGANPALKKRAWQLVLQVDLDARTGMRWGSYGMIYYWLRLEDILEKQFSSAWLALQSD